MSSTRICRRFRHRTRQLPSPPYRTCTIGASCKDASRSFAEERSTCAGGCMGNTSLLLPFASPRTFTNGAQNGADVPHRWAPGHVSDQAHDGVASDDEEADKPHRRVHLLGVLCGVGASQGAVRSRGEFGAAPLPGRAGDGRSRGGHAVYGVVPQDDEGGSGRFRGSCAFGEAQAGGVSDAEQVGARQLVLGAEHGD